MLTTIYGDSSYITWLIKPYVKQLLQNFIMPIQENFQDSFLYKENNTFN